MTVDKEPPENPIWALRYAKDVFEDILELGYQEKVARRTMDSPVDKETVEIIVKMIEETLEAFDVHVPHSKSEARRLAAQRGEPIPEFCKRCGTTLNRWRMCQNPTCFYTYIAQDPDTPDAPT